MSKRANSQKAIFFDHTIASCLPYTKEGKLDLGALYRRAGHCSNDQHLNQMRTALNGCRSIVQVLQMDDGAICKSDVYMRDGLLCALAAMLHTLIEDAERLDEQRRKEGQP